MEKKPFEDFKEIVSKEYGYSSFNALVMSYTLHGASDELTDFENVMNDAAERYAKHCAEIAFSEGCKAQNIRCRDNFIGSFMNPPDIPNIIAIERCPNAPNPYSNPQNKQQ